MLLTLDKQLSRFSHLLQDELFPVPEAEIGELSEPARRLVAILEMVQLNRFIPCSQGWNGRPQRDRYAIACAFLAKAVYNIPRTSDLLERLRSDEQLRLRLEAGRNAASRIDLFASVRRIRPNGNRAVCP